MRRAGHPLIVGTAPNSPPISKCGRTKIVRRITFHRTHVTARHAPVRHGFHAAQIGYMSAHTRPFPGSRHASAIPSCERQPGTLPVAPGVPAAGKPGTVALRAVPNGVATLGGLAKAALTTGVGAVGLPRQGVHSAAATSQYDAGALLPTSWNGGNGSPLEVSTLPRPPYLMELPATPTDVPEPASFCVLLFNVGAAVLLRLRKNGQIAQLRSYRPQIKREPENPLGL